MVCLHVLSVFIRMTHVAPIHTVDANLTHTHTPRTHSQEIFRYNSDESFKWSHFVWTVGAITVSTFYVLTNGECFDSETRHTRPTTIRVILLWISECAGHWQNIEMYYEFLEQFLILRTHCLFVCLFIATAILECWMSEGFLIIFYSITHCNIVMRRILSVVLFKGDRKERIVAKNVIVDSNWGSWIFDNIFPLLLVIKMCGFLLEEKCDNPKRQDEALKSNIWHSVFEATFGSSNVTQFKRSQNRSNCAFFSHLAP